MNIKLYSFYIHISKLLHLSSSVTNVYFLVFLVFYIVYRHQNRHPVYYSNASLTLEVNLPTCIL